MRYAKSPYTGRGTNRMKGVGSSVGSGFGKSGPKRISAAAKGKSKLATSRPKSSKMALGRKR